MGSVHFIICVGKLTVVIFEKNWNWPFADYRDVLGFLFCHNVDFLFQIKNCAAKNKSKVNNAIFRELSNKCNGSKIFEKMNWKWSYHLADQFILIFKLQIPMV
jgi:hypothetical protein